MRLLALHNPRSGQGDSGWERFVETMRVLGNELEVREVRHDVPLDLMLRDADRFDRVIAAGGDGTVSTVAHALSGRGVPVLAYPAGTANLIALNLRMPTDPDQLARVAMGGVLLQTDLAELTCVAGQAPAEVVPPTAEVPDPPEARTSRVGFALIAGAGFDAELIAGSEPLKGRLGVGAYVAAMLGNARPTVARLTLDLDGRKVQTEGMGVMLVNFGRIQLDLEIAPGADAHDGLLDVVVLRAHSVAALAPLVVRALAERLGLQGPDLAGRLDVYRARHVTVDADPPLPVQFDGETLEGTTPLSARIVPGAAVFVVPGDSAEASEHPDALVGSPG